MHFFYVLVTLSLIRYEDVPKIFVLNRERNTEQSFTDFRILFMALFAIVPRKSVNSDSIKDSMSLQSTQES